MDLFSKLLESERESVCVSVLFSTIYYPLEAGFLDVWVVRLFMKFSIFFNDLPFQSRVSLSRGSGWGKIEV